MKTIQKISLAFLILCSLAVNLKAQNQIEIVIVASSHDNSNSNQNFQAIVEKLKNFKPDMVFGEYLPETDYAKLEDNHWAKKAFKKGHDYLERLNPERVKNPSKKIVKGLQSLSSFSYYHQTRMNLAVNYAKVWDRANTEYQIFLLENEMKKRFGKEEVAKYNQMFGTQDSLKKAGLYRPGSEYSKIFFRLIYQLKQDQIYKMDCQTYDKPWGEAWAKMDSLYKKMVKKAEADSTSDEAKTVKAIDVYWKFTPAEAKVFNADAYAGLNSQKYGELDEAWNLYGGRHFYGYPGFPTDALKDMVAQWVLRNEGMCKNIIEQAQAKNAKRVVVGVGASHRIWMEEILARNPNVKIINFNNLQ